MEFGPEIQNGLGPGSVSIIAPGRLATVIDVPKDWHFIAHLCLGYPLEVHDDPELERAGWEFCRRVDPLIR